MGPKKNAKDGGPMDKFVTKRTGDQMQGDSPAPKSQVPAKKMLGEQSQRSGPPPKLHHAKEVEPHETHSFDWCYGDKTTHITCNKAGTVAEVLMRSSQFKELAKKNKNKELLIVCDGKAISSHFPCYLIEKERLIVKYVKAVDKAEEPASGSGRVQRKGPPSELVKFHIQTKGGEEISRIMRNPAIQTKYQEMTVYAYKGETVKKALKGDGRLLPIVFEKNCALANTSTEVNTEMSNLVDDLHGKSFKIIKLNQSNPPESQSGSLDDAYVVESLGSADENQDPSNQSPTTESVDDNAPKEKKLDNGMATAKVFHEVPHSKETQRHLSLQFKDLVTKMKDQPSPKHLRVQNLFRVQFGKNSQTCDEVKIMKKLMTLSDSVCQVRINGSPNGSGFLLFDKFVLTNAHVVKDIYHACRGQLGEMVTVHFSFLSLDQVEGGQNSGDTVVVDDIIGQYESDESGRMYDWALLRLRTDQTLPEGLLKHFAYLPQSGGICIIGHPDGGVKKIDPCFIIPTEDHSKIVAEHYHNNPEGVVSENYGHIQMITKDFFNDVEETLKLDSQLLTYPSCFYYGSSGSPVFDKYCNVVAMHTGGYPYRDAKGKPQSVIAYGHPLSFIVEHIIIKIVQTGRHDVLKAYLACSYAQHQIVMTNLKKLVESRNLTAFKNAFNSSVDTDDERLKEFFEFFSQEDDPDPMETES